ncbi:MAG: hypothetical protein GX442_10775 [Candidatus Riflebacteria bacterium]|nr:hypothetical protein [Candidatus Riflebacteria bacterium]
MAEGLLRFYFDFQCPYSYLGWELLHAHLREKDFPVEMLAIGANPPANPALLGRSLWSEKRWQAIGEHGKAIGLTIRRPPAELTTNYPQQALPYYDGIGMREFVSAVFKGIFALGLDFSNTLTLQNHLQSEGVDTLPFTKAMADPAAARQAEDLTLLWGSHRIRTIPLLEAGSERLAGVFDKRSVDNFLTLSLG